MMKEVGISELFETVQFKEYNITDLENGPYPLISATGQNNGVIGYYNKYSIDACNEPHITVAGVCGGSCFVQTCKFGMLNNGHMNKVLRLTKQYKHLEGYLGLLAYLMTEKFTKIYSYSTKLNKERLMKETITLPVIVRCIDEDTMKKLHNGMVTLDEVTNNGKNKDYQYEINENLLTNFVYTTMM